MELARTIDKKTLENKYNLDDTKEIEKDIAELLVSYDNEAKGPGRMTVVNKGLSSYLKKVFDCAGRHNNQKMNKVETDYKMKVQEMETKIALNKQELERLKDADKTAKFKVNISFTI
jgi:uncharacterized small protein (DUF1192 family)